jgi:hypothetical protein
MKNDDYVLVGRDVLDNLLSRISELKKSLSIVRNPTELYSNKQVMDLLHADDKLIRKYREQGLIGYHQVGKKYWYSQGDIEIFLKNNHYQAFA